VNPKRTQHTKKETWFNMSPHTIELAIVIIGTLAVAYAAYITVIKPAETFSHDLSSYTGGLL